MRKSIKILILAMLFITPLCVSGQENELELTIEKANELALNNNKNYQVSQEEVNRYKHKVRQNLGFLPTITLQGIKNLDEKLMEIEMPAFYPVATPEKIKLDFTKNYEFTFQIVQPVFTGGKVWLSFKNAKLDLDIAREKELNAKKELLCWRPGSLKPG
jgi:outer membrane protein TolC